MSVEIDPAEQLEFNRITPFLTAFPAPLTFEPSWN